MEPLLIVTPEPEKHTQVPISILLAQVCETMVDFRDYPSASPTREAVSSSMSQALRIQQRINAAERQEYIPKKIRANASRQGYAMLCII